MRLQGAAGQPAVAVRTSDTLPSGPVAPPAGTRTNGLPSQHARPSIRPCTTSWNRPDAVDATLMIWSSARHAAGAGVPQSLTNEPAGVVAPAAIANVVGMHSSSSVR